MKEVDLTNNPLYMAMVDDEDYERVVNLGYWRLVKPDKRQKRIYVRCDKAGMVYLHRFILRLEQHDQTSVSFKDGNSLNCQKSNLILCYPPQRIQRRRVGL